MASASATIQPGTPNSCMRPLRGVVSWGMGCSRAFAFGQLNRNGAACAQVPHRNARRPSPRPRSADAARPILHMRVVREPFVMVPRSGARRGERRLELFLCKSFLPAGHFTIERDCREADFCFRTRCAAGMAGLSASAHAQTLDTVNEANALRSQNPLLADQPGTPPSRSRAILG